MVKHRYRYRTEFNKDINIWYHDYARRLYRKRKLPSRICSHLFKIVGVIASILLDNVKVWMNIDIKVYQYCL